MEVPSFIEDHISQVPALQLLMKMGYQYLTPDQALDARGGRSSNVLLETILRQQLQKINSIIYKDKEFEFSDANINAAVVALRDLPLQDGYLVANQYFYDLVTLGKSFEQNILGDKKSFSFKYIDWKRPENNVFHITEEFSVMRHGRNDHYRPDIVLFVNGIPMVVIECKSPIIKEPLDKALEQHMRNQQDDGIRSLYLYSNILIGLAVHDAKFATTATQKEFWNIWKEMFYLKEEEKNFIESLSSLKNKNLQPDDKTILFSERYRSVLKYFEEQYKEEQLLTEQDKLLYCICKPGRLLELMYNFIVFDDGIKKIARYQQYFSVKQTMTKISKTDINGKRTGGVIWHTQGSGKSLTMVMLAQQIAMNPEIKNPKILLVTDRIELDDQITNTFKKCGMPVINAKTGRHLADLIESNTAEIITTVINKFEAAVNQIKPGLDTKDTFILVDEGHRSQYGSFNINMLKVFPDACFIAFTGTPLMKKEKNTAAKFGGIIDEYSIVKAVADKAVVPLLYEGRHNLFDVNEKPLDSFFEKVAEPLTPYGKAALKRKFSTKSQLNKADQIIYARAWDISEHFSINFQGTGFKGQLVAPSKLIAIKYKNYFDEIGKVYTDVLISPPDTREGEEDVFEKIDDKVKLFWKAMMDKYGNPDKYEKMLINAFKKQEFPEIIIVVDKLLTGFDAPVNTVMYLTRQLREHSLLQAIARVNRLHPGKDHGFIIDYFGNLENLDAALNTYSGLSAFDNDDLDGTLANISEEIAKLPQAHSEVWDIFKTIANKYDETAYEELLSDEAIRHSFYEKLSVFGRILKIALSSFEFVTKTSENTIDKYKKDARFFLSLRISVKRRYSDEADYKEYEPQVQKLIDQHISTEGEILKITQLVDIFDKDQREAEVEKISGKAAKADHIATRTSKAISIKMNEDPVFYKKLSQLLKETIEDYHRHRISEAEYFAKAKEYEETFFSGKRADIPMSIQGDDVKIAFYNLAVALLSDIVKQSSLDKTVFEKIAKGIDEIIQSIIFINSDLLVDWQNNRDVEGKIRIAIDDYCFELKKENNFECPLQKIDELIEECLKVAKLKYTK
ncbi:MAG: HsdR family type I site-specific deoxyribonuclease [Bacteroidales bacterium]|jgi:type I restriction enzyme R subunit|nr:HsdR family type I site-specific deoxyribonuclease [Bacteroidales bacterium]MDD4214908.1 HsdR family type I site-specific deoxyribonuclease [Bacteroidales bacterium]